MKISEITDNFVDAVEEKVGMSYGAWDMVDPKEIIAAVLSIIEEEDNEDDFLIYSVNSNSTECPS